MELNNISNFSYLGENLPPYFALGISLTTTLIGSAYLYRFAVKANEKANYWGRRVKNFFLFFPNTVEAMQGICVKSTASNNKKTKILAIAFAISNLFIAITRDLLIMVRMFFCPSSQVVQQLERQADQKTQRITRIFFKASLIPLCIFASTAIAVNYQLMF